MAFLVDLDPVGQQVDRREQRRAQRSHAHLAGPPEGVGARPGMPDRRVWLLNRFRLHVLAFHGPAVGLPGDRLFGPCPGQQVGDFDQVGERGDTAVRNAERRPLHAARSCQADLHAAVGNVIEHRRPLGGAHPVVDLERREKSGAADADLFGRARNGGQDEFRSGTVAEVRRAVMLDLPPAVDAGVFRRLCLLDGLAQ